MTLTDEQKELGFDHYNIQGLIYYHAPFKTVSVYIREVPHIRPDDTRYPAWVLVMQDNEEQSDEIGTIVVKINYPTPESAMVAATILARAIQALDRMSEEVEGGGKRGA
jgi:hypothetical protein